jgi:hypothetical protein
MPRFALDHTPLLDPPPHVLAEVDAAWERAQDLFAGELELHFAINSVTGRVNGELRIPDGETWELLSAGKMLPVCHRYGRDCSTPRPISRARS